MYLFSALRFIAVIAIILITVFNMLSFRMLVEGSNGERMKRRKTLIVSVILLLLCIGSLLFIPH